MKKYTNNKFLDANKMNRNTQNQSTPSSLASQELFLSCVFPHSLSSQIQGSQKYKTRKTSMNPIPNYKLLKIYLIDYKSMRLSPNSCSAMPFTQFLFWLKNIAFPNKTNQSVRRIYLMVWWYIYIYIYIDSWTCISKLMKTNREQMRRKAYNNY